MLNAYITMMSRLQAEEALLLVSTTAAGTGAMKKDYLRRFMAALGRAIKPVKKARTEDDLRALGVQVVREPKRG